MAGYGRYEISNHALPGHASRHNRVYWSGAGWWGSAWVLPVLPGGSGVARPRTRAAYSDWHDQGVKEECGASMPLDDRLLVGLRRREGVDLVSMGCPASDLLLKRWQPFFSEGLVEIHAGRCRLSDPRGMALSNRVLVELLLWWEQQVWALLNPVLQSRDEQLSSRQQRWTERRLLLREPQQISGHPNLTVTRLPSADADHGDGEVAAHLGLDRLERAPARGRSNRLPPVDQPV